MPSLTQSDAALLRRYSTTADAQAMGELVRRHAGMVFGTARRITCDNHDAEDVAQSCFLELIRSAERLPDEKAAEKAGGSAAGWLHSTAVHRALDLIRNKKTRKRHEHEAAQLRKEAADTAQWWEELSPRVDEAIASLPAQLREPLILHFLQGRTQAEVAEVLALSQPTVSRRLEQAVNELRRKLGRDDEQRAGAIGAVAFGLMLANHAGASAPETLTASLGKMAIAGVGTGSLALPVQAGAQAIGWTLQVKAGMAAVILLAVAGGGLGLSAMWQDSSAPSVVAVAPVEKAPPVRVVPSEDRPFAAANLELRVQDVQRCATWWRDKLAFRVESQSSDKAVVRRDRCTVTLVVGGAGDSALLVPLRERDSIEDLYDELTERGGRGVNILAPTRSADIERAPELVVADVEGNKITFRFSK